MSANRRVECGMAPDEEAAGMPQTESYWISREMILVHSLLDCALMGFFNGRQILQLTPPQLAEPDRHRRRWCRERRVTIGSSSIKASPCPTRLRASRNPGIMKPSSSEFRSRAQRTVPGCSAASPDMGPHTRAATGVGLRAGDGRGLVLRREQPGHERDGPAHPGSHPGGRMASSRYLTMITHTDREGSPAGRSRAVSARSGRQSGRADRGVLCARQDATTEIR